MPKSLQFAAQNFRQQLAGPVPRITHVVWRRYYRVLSVQSIDTKSTRRDCNHANLSSGMAIAALIRDRGGLQMKTTQLTKTIGGAILGLLMVLGIGFASSTAA